MMEKLKRSKFSKMNEEDEDLIDDVIIENRQAIEQTSIHTNIMSGTMDTFASIISNNQNLVLKRLATLTILLSIPVLIASIYGMNVPLPYQDSHFAFWIPTAVSLLILAYAIYNFVKQYKR